MRVLYDGDGDSLFGLTPGFDVVLCISVLHHIPDYSFFVSRLVGLVNEGGALASYQDPDSYPRRRRRDSVADRASYFTWRLTQGDLVAGAHTRLRRLRGHYDETMPSDMTEYHVVREGVDDKALVQSLRAEFGQVDRILYWATQAAALQQLGERLGLRNTFGIEAINRRVS